jgi:hypothetical protein
MITLCEYHQVDCGHQIKEDIAIDISGEQYGFKPSLQDLTTKLNCFQKVNIEEFFLYACIVCLLHVLS